MKKKKVKFVIYMHHIPTKPDGSCLYDRFDVMYHVDEVEYVYLTNAIKYAYRRYSGKDNDFCVAVRVNGKILVLYKTANYRLFQGQTDCPVSFYDSDTLTHHHGVRFTIDAEVALAKQGGNP